MKDNSIMTFIAGAAIGAVLGVLFAPDKGEVTRRKVRAATRDGREKLYATLDELEKALDEQVDEDEEYDSPEEDEAAEPSEESAKTRNIDID